jgi:flavin reductase (DIM6/NTAB) family NADH-FMN oxidoreductase RutF
VRILHCPRTHSRASEGMRRSPRVVAWCLTADPSGPRAGYPVRSTTVFPTLPPAIMSRYAGTIASNP